MADKVDFKKTLDSYHARPGEIRIVDVPDHSYLMIDGQGDPNTSPDFAGAIETLYPLAYATKFASKNELGRDYVVPPLEGLWWSEDMSTFTTLRDKSRWSWTLMIMTPDWIDDKLLDLALDKARNKSDPTRLAATRLSTLSEGLCVQTLHVGSFDDETQILAQIHNEFIPGHGLAIRGLHHEIYLSDFRKTAPERLRTILRQPVTAT